MPNLPGDSWILCPSLSEQKPSRDFKCLVLATITEMLSEAHALHGQGVLLPTVPADLEAGSGGQRSRLKLCLETRDVR